MVILDTDQFKRVNDTLGHHVGDPILISFVRRLQSLARESDRLFRYGGAEPVFLGEMTADGALAALQSGTNATTQSALQKKCP